MQAIVNAELMQRYSHLAEGDINISISELATSTAAAGDVDCIPGQKTKQKKGALKATIGIQICLTTDTGCLLSANSLKDTRTDYEGVHDFYTDVAQAAIAKLDALVSSGSCIDELTADQLIIYMAMIPFESKILCEPANESSSLHLQTSIYVAGLFSKSVFRIEEQGVGRARLITCAPVACLGASSGSTSEAAMAGVLGAGCAAEQPDTLPVEPYPTSSRPRAEESNTNNQTVDDEGMHPLEKRVRKLR